MTVLEVIQKSTEFLTTKGVESPRLQVELLLAHVLKMPRMKLYLNFDRVLKGEELDVLRDLVKRRGLREPLQHIIGSTSFCGLEIAVNKHVLIPRPETEMLAERGWIFLKSLEQGSRPPMALDFGTGSGCLPIALAVHSLSAQLHAIDISEAALEVARQNAVRHNVADRIQFHLGNGFAALPPGLKFDLIVSNPPYIPSAEIDTLQTEVRDFDPRSALDGGTDGLDFYRILATESAAFLQPQGKLMLEFGDGQAPAIQQLFQTAGWEVESIERDLTQRERLLIAKLKS